jgi:hypothetical protein
MRVYFKPPTVSQLGFGPIHVYRGLEYQRGAGLGSLFRTLLRIVLPIAKSVARGVGKEALHTVAGLAEDVSQGANLQDAATKHLKAGAKRAVRRGAIKIAQAMDGEGLGFTPRSRKLVKKSINRAQKRKATKRKPKKKDTLGFYFPK